MGKRYRNLWLRKEEESIADSLLLESDKKKVPVIQLVEDERLYVAFLNSLLVVSI